MRLYNLNDFNATLPQKPYCTNDLSLGLKIRSKKKALTHKYIQVNDNYIKFLVIDCDHDDLFIYEKEKLPAPNFIVKNKENGHFHYVYALTDPIYKDYINKAQNLIYFAKIQQVFTSLCNGDTNYINLITKNPNHEFWHMVEVNYFYSYTLDELADYVTLPQKITKKNAVGEGRNCYLFDTVRKFAYRNVLFYKANEAKFEDFYNVILDKLNKSNFFPNAPSLKFSEIKAIAKSISRWTWKNFTAEKFSEIQMKRSHKQKTIKNKNERLKNYEFS